MRTAGEITVIDPGSDQPIQRAGTLQCVHCGRHWVPQPGSRSVRGYCARCNGPICGARCAECVPIEQQIENIEADRPVEFRRLQLSVPAVPAFRVRRAA